MGMSQAERTARAKHAAEMRWADPEAIERARQVAKANQQSHWERVVDPDGTLDPRLRAKLADRRRRAHFADMTRRSLKARRLKAEAKAAQQARAVAQVAS